MKIILSIKPEFAFKIFDGTKRYEFRKNIFKQDVDRIVVYASSPVQRVIGEFEVKNILNDDTETIWNLTQQFSGISKQSYDEYFAHKERAFAIQVGKVKKYSKPKLLSDYDIDFAPQSFVYL